MSRTTARCDQIISLIDRCLAESEQPLPAESRPSSDQPANRASA
jgi:hypothetical protein